MSRKTKKSGSATFAAKRKVNVLGRSALTGTRVLRPVAKRATVTARQVRSALRSLSANGVK